MRKIGLLSDVKDGRIVLNEAYYNFAQRMGNVKLINPRDSEIYKVDLLILPGGADVYPLRYGEAPTASGQPNMDFEYFDMVNLPNYVNNKTPIFGICRGLQTLNVLFNGNLKQHVFEPTSYSRDELVHFAKTNSGQLIKINSLHHQVINVIGDGFEVTLKGFEKDKKAVGKELHIEGILHKEFPIAAVQFHPEEIMDTYGAEKTIEFVASQIQEIVNRK